MSGTVPAFVTGFLGCVRPTCGRSATEHGHWDLRMVIGATAGGHPAAGNSLPVFLNTMPIRLIVAIQQASAACCGAGGDDVLSGGFEAGWHPGMAVEQVAEGA